MEATFGKGESFLNRYVGKFLNCRVNKVNSTTAPCLVCAKYMEDDNSVTLSLDNFDIVVNGKNVNEAKKLLIEDLREYVEDYMSEPEYWSKDINRKKQVEYLVNLFMINNTNN